MTRRETYFPPLVTSPRGYDDALSIYGILELVPPLPFGARHCRRVFKAAGSIDKDKFFEALKSLSKLDKLDNL